MALRATANRPSPSRGTVPAQAATCCPKYRVTASSWAAVTGLAAIPACWAKGSRIILGAPQPAHRRIAPQHHHCQGAAPRSLRTRGCRGPSATGPRASSRRAARISNRGPRLADAEGQRIAHGAQKPLDRHGYPRHPPVHGGAVRAEYQEQAHSPQGAGQSRQGPAMGQRPAAQCPHRSKVVNRVVCHCWPGSRMAAAARLDQEGPSASAAGRLCQGSMHTKRTLSVLALQIRV